MSEQEQGPREVSAEQATLSDEQLAPATETQGRDLELTLDDSSESSDRAGT